MKRPALPPHRCAAKFRLNRWTKLRHADIVSNDFSITQKPLTRGTAARMILNCRQWQPERHEALLVTFKRDLL
ncbi:hypothetical protein ABIB17_001130 [Arthrobacter sp. UYEF6]